ncbi:hypothetical protein GCM10022284_43490 [Streptomyces hundungensis]|uniref:hypothetical protein n=1 Tax=Streptomyces sp. CB01201 TaxID=2020324 RepID=UPI000C27BDA0|nr:hypothetical protein [Streptomyces sp. CB01201]PJN01375.1 hypothetical protein CG740_19475 [Streptomyces sp. CB01201]
MKNRGRGRDAATPPPGDAPWWAGLGLTGGIVLVAIGVGLLLWLVWGGRAATEDWHQYYGAAKVLAIGCVITGTTLLASRRERK